MITIRCTNPEKAKLSSKILLVGINYTVGRKGAEINFPEDQSISRNHAEITVEHPMANTTDPLLIPTVVVADLGSKFGTFANDGIDRKSKMAMREPLNLSPGDRFKFGLQWNEFKIEYTPLIATVSAVKDPLLRRFKMAIMTLGGHLVQEWSKECNYVVMESLTLTVKAICGLLSAKYIVTPSYFDDMLECARMGKPFPNPNNFLPPLGEKSLGADVTFEPIEGRSELFSSKVFVFCTSKQLKKLGPAVEAGGGTCKVITEVRSKDLLRENYILMKPNERDILMADHDVVTKKELYQTKKRLIEEGEIGLSAVLLSINTNCNPYHKFAIERLLPSKLASQSQSASEVLFPGTQTQEQETQLSLANDSENIVNETLTDGERSQVKIKPEPMSQFAKKRDAVKDKGKVEEGEPSSKKRPAEDSLGRSQDKRSRQTRSTASKLSALFGVSDDEDDDNDVVLVPETQAVREEHASSTMDPRSQAVQEIDMVLASDEDLEQTPEKRTTRSSRFTPSPKKRASPQKYLFKEPEPSTSSRAGTKRKLLQTQTPEESPLKIESVEEQSNKKQKTTEASQSSSVDGKNLVKVENMTPLTDIKDILKGVPGEDFEAPPKVQEVRVPLCKGPKVEPTVQIVDGRTVNNFKSFKKILPLSMQSNNNSFASQSSSGDVSSAISALRRIKLVYEIHNFSPSAVIITEDENAPDYDGLQANIKRRATEEEKMSIEEVMPEIDPPIEQDTGKNQRTTRASKQQGKESQQEITEPPQRQTRNRRNAPVILVDDDDNDMFQF